MSVMLVQLRQGARNRQSACEVHALYPCLSLSDIVALFEKRDWECPFLKLPWRAFSKRAACRRAGAVVPLTLHSHREGPLEDPELVSLEHEKEPKCPCGSSSQPPASPNHIAGVLAECVGKLGAEL